MYSASVFRVNVVSESRPCAYSPRLSSASVTTQMVSSTSADVGECLVAREYHWRVCRPPVCRSGVIRECLIEVFRTHECRNSDVIRVFTTCIFCGFRSRPARMNDVRMSLCAFRASLGSVNVIRHCVIRLVSSPIAFRHCVFPEGVDH
jgi:hypothetical protein